jgi:integrase
MVSIRRRKRVKRDVWIVDYRDGAGIRRYETCSTSEDAKAVAARKTLESQQVVGAPSVNAHITVKDYAARWLEQIKLTVRASTRETYVVMMNKHLVPALGWVKLRRLTGDHLRALLVEKLETKALAPGTVRLLRATISGMLAAAVDDHVLLRNPAAGLGRKMRRVQQLEQEQRVVKAFSVEQLARFLTAARDRFAGHYPLFFVMARTGIRLGEALALEWDQVDLHEREIWIRQTLARGRAKDLESRLSPPKSNRERRVDLGLVACQLLETHRREAQEAALAHGSSSLPRFVFNRAGAPLSSNMVRSVFDRILPAAKLPEHFTPHALRHTYAVHLLQRNTPITYVKDQLGHASISVTVDTYGRWLPTGDKRYVDALDGGGEQAAATAAAAATSTAGGRSPEASGDRLVTNLRTPAMRRSQVVGLMGNREPAAGAEAIRTV